MKKIVSLLLCSLLLIGLVSGCGSTNNTTDTPSSQSSDTSGASSEKENQEPITVTYWLQTNNRTEHAKIAVEEFAKVKPNITVELVSISVDDLKKNLQIASASRTLPSMWYNWGGTLGSFYPENGLSYDLTEYAKEHNWSDKYSKTALELVTLAGQVSGAPQSVASFGISYNKTLFEKAGIDSEPTTYAEFEEAMAKLKASGVTPLALAAKNGWQLFRLIELLFEKNLGAEKHDQLLAMNTDIWLDEGITKSFQEFKSYVDASYFPEGFLTQEPTDMSMLMTNGLATMIIDSPGTINRLVAQGLDPNDYSIFPLPLSAEGNRMTSYVQMNQFNAKSSDEELDAAVGFHEFSYSQEVVEKAKTYVQHPTAFKALALPDDQPWTKKLVAGLEERGGFLITDQGLPQEIVTKLFEFQDAVAMGQMAPEEVGPTVKELADDYLANK